MGNLQQIIKEVDGVQFYTDSRTGKSGISQSGLAILCGVDRRTISSLIKSLSEKKPYNGLEHLVDKLSECLTETETGMKLCNDELCIAIIRYYDRKGKEEARFTFDKFASIGFNSWVQSITGWSCDSPNDLANTPVQGLTELNENLNKHHDALISKLSEQVKALEKISSQLESNTSAAVHVGLAGKQDEQENPWTPPPSLPNMTKEEWDALPLHEQRYYSETKQEREARIIRELEEVYRRRS